MSDPTTGTRVNVDWFSEHEALPVEVEATDLAGRFSKSTVPLSFFLQFLNASLDQPNNRQLSLYLAQFPIPDELRPSLPAPQLLNGVSMTLSTVWWGVTPTRTPLHADPNHNLLHQLTGTKLVRLMPPEQGRELFGQTRKQLMKPLSKFRDEEMLSLSPGSEGALLEEAVWSHENHVDGFETTIGPGESLLVPMDWWHAVRGVSTQSNKEEITASVNWWYR